MTARVSDQKDQVERMARAKEGQPQVSIRH